MGAPSNQDYLPTETELERDFLAMVELQEMRSMIESAIEKLDEIGFDVFTYHSLMGANSLQFMAFKLFQSYNFFYIFNLKLEAVVAFS